MHFSTLEGVQLFKIFGSEIISTNFQEIHFCPHALWTHPSIVVKKKLAILMFRKTLVISPSPSLSRASIMDSAQSKTTSWSTSTCAKVVVYGLYFTYDLITYFNKLTRAMLNSPFSIWTTSEASMVPPPSLHIIYNFINSEPQPVLISYVITCQRR